MSHYHHDHSEKHTSHFALVFFINLTFVLIEIVGGYLTNSLAIWSDALHDIGDTLSLGLSWRLEIVAKQKRDHRFSFGYKRFSLLGALINGTVLLTGTVFVLSKAIPRLIHPENVHSEGMFGIAVLGILVNGLATLRLKKGKSISESMMSLHLLEDVLGWISVLIVSIAINLGNYTILDPVLSILLAVFIIYNSIKRIKKTLLIFLQSIPDDIDVPELEKALRQFQNVTNIHDTHVWSLDGSYHILTTHIVVLQSTTPEEILALKCLIREKISSFDVQHMTLEIEFAGESCAHSC
jgi:cobalt-zinc-cadmium efflux system protein